MGMREAILAFAGQFDYEPRVENEANFQPRQKFIVAGMGGSNLTAGLLRPWKPELPVIEHRDYGLPALPKNELKDYLLIASSYSGNTEETLSAFGAALENKMAVIVIATGGKLLDMAEKRKMPYIKMPATGIQPRSAVGFNFRAVLKAMGEEAALKETGKLARELKPGDYKERGRALAEKLSGRVPVIYASERNRVVAYNWKIKFNETGKTPAFYNVFPEVNHNEMTGFDGVAGAKELSSQFHFIFLRDQRDNPKIQKRMEVMAKLFAKRGLSVESVELADAPIFESIFSALILADWAAFYTAENQGADPEAVPMVEEFKKMV